MIVSHIHALYNTLVPSSPEAFNGYLARAQRARLHSPPHDQHCPVSSGFLFSFHHESHFMSSSRRELVELN